ncbi:hypothetical protein B0H11DRAFT_2193119 [Mycena galericulata]|nr:hypothetical protein B0H11DRAFT_2193119 [Mycena galericulata]
MLVRDWFGRSPNWEWSRTKPAQFASGPKFPGVRIIPLGPARISRGSERQPGGGNDAFLRRASHLDRRQMHDVRSMAEEPFFTKCALLTAPMREVGGHERVLRQRSRRVELGSTISGSSLYRLALATCNAHRMDGTVGVNLTSLLDLWASSAPERILFTSGGLPLFPSSPVLTQRTLWDRLGRSVVAQERAFPSLGRLVGLERVPNGCTPVYIAQQGELDPVAGAPKLITDARSQQIILRVYVREELVRSRVLELPVATSVPYEFGVIKSQRKFYMLD